MGPPTISLLVPSGASQWPRLIVPPSLLQPKTSRPLHVLRCQIVSFTIRPSIRSVEESAQHVPVPASDLWGWLFASGYSFGNFKKGPNRRTESNFGCFQFLRHMFPGHPAMVTPQNWLCAGSKFGPSCFWQEPRVPESGRRKALGLFRKWRWIP